MAQEVVHKPLQQQPNLVVEWIYAKPKQSANSKRFDKIPCPACKQIKCYEHCNNCGKSIRWDKDEFGRRWIYEDGTDIVHYNPITRKGCMNSGTKSGKYLDVNLKREIQTYTPDTSNFYKDNVVREKQNNITKDAKRDRWMKLTNYPYVKNNITQANLLKVKEYEKWSFKY